MCTSVTHYTKVHDPLSQGAPGSDGPPGRDGAAGVKVRDTNMNLLLPKYTNSHHSHHLVIVCRESEVTLAPLAPLELQVPRVLLDLSDPSESRETEERL